MERLCLEHLCYLRKMLAMVRVDGAWSKLGLQNLHLESHGSGSSADYGGHLWTRACIGLWTTQVLVIRGINP